MYVGHVGNVGLGDDDQESLIFIHPIFEICKAKTIVTILSNKDLSQVILKGSFVNIST